jgi:hypothetical protein
MFSRWPSFPRVASRRLDATTSLAYILHLVESLERLNFDDACMHQLDDDASDLFSLQRPVFTRVPDDIVSAIDTLEEILS